MKMTDVSCVFKKLEPFCIGTITGKLCQDERALRHRPGRKDQDLHGQPSAGALCAQRPVPWQPTSSLGTTAGSPQVLS